MNALRTFASALCIVVGALLIALWAASTAALAAVKDSTVIEDSAQRALATDSATAALVDGGSERVLTALEDLGVNTAIPGLELAVNAIVEAIVTSDGFATMVHTQTRSIREQVVAGLDSGEDGPIVVTLDFSAEVNDKLGDIPLIGDSLPTVTVPGVPVEVMDDDTADTMRSTWDWLHVAQKWFGWLGLALLACGVVVSYRRRWYAAKVALAVAGLSGAVWAVVTLLEPESIAGWLPGGAVAAAFLSDLIAQASDSVTTTMGYVALGAMIVGLALVWLAARKRRGVKA